ncbi:hypothetical protein ACLOJK_034875 [Asimina triloba]
MAGFSPNRDQQQLAKSSSLSSSVRQPLSDPTRTRRPANINYCPTPHPAARIAPPQIVTISVPKSASKVQNMDTVGHHSDHQFSSRRKTESASIQTEIRQMRQRTHSIGHSSSKIIQPQTAHTNRTAAAMAACLSRPRPPVSIPINEAMES